MSTLSENHCFICLASIGLKSEETSSGANLKIKKKVCDQFHKFLSNFINLKINLADFKNVYKDKRQLQTDLCCDDCFVSVEKFCETFESYQCLQMELLQMLESFSTRMKRKTKANAPTQFQKDFIWKVFQKIQGEFPEGNITDKINSVSPAPNNDRNKTPQGSPPSSSASPSAALIAKIECDDDDDFNMNSDCDEFPLLLDTDSGKCDIQVQERDPLEEDKDEGIVEEVLEVEPLPRNVKKSGSPGVKVGGKRQMKPSTKGVKMSNDDKDKHYGPTTISNYSGQQRYQCLMCRKIFFKRRLLLLHLRRHADERVYHCQVCWKEFLTPELLTGHQIRIHRVTTIGDESKIICEICNEVFYHVAARNRHLMNVHGAEKKFVCEECDRKFFTNHCLVMHKKTHLNTTEKPFECDLCPSRFELKTGLTKHKTRVHDAEWKERMRQRARNKICEVCGKAFVYQPQLLRHKALVHGEKNGVDVTKFRNRNIKKNFKCHFENCGKAFDARTTLEDHIASHTGERNHQCDLCPNSYMQLTTLRKHIKYNHSGTKVKKKKNIKCPYENCDSAFYDTSALTDHLASHTGQKNFQCQHCGKSYAQRHNLKKHLNKHHSETPKSFLCGQCGKGFDSSRQLNLHEALAHKNGANVAASSTVTAQCERK